MPCGFVADVFKNNKFVLKIHLSGTQRFLSASPDKLLYNDCQCVSFWSDVMMSEMLMHSRQHTRQRKIAATNIDNLVYIFSTHLLIHNFSFLLVIHFFIIYNLLIAKGIFNHF